MDGICLERDWNSSYMYPEWVIDLFLRMLLFVFTSTWIHGKFCGRMRMYWKLNTSQYLFHYRFHESPDVERRKSVWTAWVVWTQSLSHPQVTQVVGLSSTWTADTMVHKLHKLIEWRPEDPNVVLQGEFRWETFVSHYFGPFEADAWYAKKNLASVSFGILTRGAFLEPILSASTLVSACVGFL